MPRIHCITVVFLISVMQSMHAVGQENFVLSDGRTCGMTGSASSAAGKELNRHKNRFVPPVASEIDPGVTLEALLEPGDDLDRFDQERGATISGFVIAVKRGGKETCNCKATADVDKDTHIELALFEGAPKTQRVVVEVTPRLRAKMAEQGIDWTTAALRDSETGIKGRWVEITGWLLFDSMHVHEAENTAPGNPNNWRATGWEIHPVTSIQVIETPTPAPAPFQPNLFADRHANRLMEFHRDPAKRAALQQRNASLVAAYNPDELDEDLPTEIEAAPPSLAPCPNVVPCPCPCPCPPRRRHLLFRRCWLW